MHHHAMQRSAPTRSAGSTRAARRLGVLAAITIAASGLAACSDDGDDDTDATVAVDEEFPGDALDATCARLETAEGDDRDAIAAELLDELSALGDEELAINTMEMAVVDRCPDWADAVTAAVAARS